MRNKISNKTSLYTNVDRQTARQVALLAKSNRVTVSEYMRQVLLQHLSEREKLKDSEQERSFLEELKKATNRLCKLLSKTAIDTQVIARFIWETSDDEGKDLYRTCHMKAIERVKERATQGEQEIIKLLRDDR